MLTASMVSALRGAPITILVLLMIERKPLAMEYIRRHTRYSQNTISDSMALLADYGMVIQTARYVYQIADGVQQLPLMATELVSGEDEPEPENVIDAEFRSQNLRAEDASQSNLCHESENRSQNLRAVNTTNDPTNVESVIRSQKMRPKSTKTPQNGARSQKFRARSQNLRPATLASSTTNLNLESKDLKLLASTSISKNQQEVLDCLDRYGIWEPTRTNLSKLEHVSAALVDYHCRKAPNIRMAIYRILHNWEMKAEDAPKERSWLERNSQYLEFLNH